MDSVPLEQTRSVMQEALKVFTPYQDVEAVKAIKSHIAQVQTARQAQQLEAKKLVQDWLAKTTEAEQYVAQLKAASTTPQTIEKLENDKFAEVRAVSSMEQECESLESSVRQLQDQLKALQTKAEIMDKDAQMEEPVLAASMALFSQITNIFWDYDSQFVKGYVSLNNDIRPFQLDPKRLSSKYIADYLWVNV